MNQILAFTFASGLFTGLGVAAGTVANTHGDFPLVAFVLLALALASLLRVVQIARKASR